MINTNRNLTREQQEEWNEKVKHKLSNREEFRKKWEIKGNNIWWEKPFKRCFEAGYYEALDDNDILYGDDAKRFLDNMKKMEEDKKE